MLQFVNFCKENYSGQKYSSYSIFHFHFDVDRQILVSVDRDSAEFTVKKIIWILNWDYDGLT